MHAIVLAGGFGTRLSSVIGEDTPKPMAPVAGEPFLAYHLRYLKSQGISQVMLSVHHRRQVIKDYFGRCFEGLPVMYAEEITPLGTGGAVKHALSRLETAEPVLVINGDSLVETDIQAMAEAHRAANAALTICLRRMDDCSRYGEACFDEASQRITAFRYPGRPGLGWISTGCYVMSPHIFEQQALPNAFSFERDFQQPYLASVPIFAWPRCGYFIDIGVPVDYARAQKELATRAKLRAPDDATLAA